MINKFKKTELFIFLFAIALIFISEYIYIVLKNPQRAIFIGLWPPTIIAILIYANIKMKL